MLTDKKKKIRTKNIYKCGHHFFFLIFSNEAGTNTPSDGCVVVHFYQWMLLSPTGSQGNG